MSDRGIGSGMANRDADVMRQEAVQQEPSIKWLTRLVIGLGIVLIGGVILLFVLLATGAHLKDRPATTAGPAPREAAVADLALTLPKNSRISDVLSSGSRIVVRVRLADGAERLYALDGTTLRPLNSLTIQVEK